MSRTSECISEIANLGKALAKDRAITIPIGAGVAWEIGIRASDYLLGSGAVWDAIGGGTWRPDWFMHAITLFGINRLGRRAYSLASEDYRPGREFAAGSVLSAAAISGKELLESAMSGVLEFETGDVVAGAIGALADDAIRYKNKIFKPKEDLSTYR